MMLLLVYLTLLSLLSCFCLVVRTGAGLSRTEQLISTLVLWNLHLITPIYALGIFNKLNLWNLTLSSLLLSLVVLGIVLSAPNRKQLLRTVLTAAWQLLRLPVDAVRLLFRRKDLSLLGLLYCFFVVVWFSLSAYLGPLWRYWDETWYHESIIGFTIQNQGFRMVNLPSVLQPVNGMERLCEMTQLWFVMYGGRALIDITNIVFWPLLFMSMYGLMLRYTNRKDYSIAAAVALMLMPANVRFLQSNMVDMHAAALLLAALYFVTSPRWERRTVALSIVSLTLAVGTKTLLLLPVGILAIYMAVRIVRSAQPAWRRGLQLLAGVLSIGGMSAWTHVRNWIYFHNPFWPVLKYDNKRFGIHWDGWVTYVDHADMKKNNTWTVYKNLLDRPYSIADSQSSAVMDYGPGIAWVLVPLALFSVTVIWGIGLRRVLRRQPADPILRQVILITLVATTSFLVTPALYIARYHIAYVAMLLLCVAWLLLRWGLQRALAQALYAMQIASIMMIHWALPSLYYSRDELRQAWRMPAAHRESSIVLHAVVHERTGLAREVELKPGSIVAFDYLSFAGLLWNNHYSNQLVYLDDDKQPLQQAQKLGATWIYTRPKTELFFQLVGSRGEWEHVGGLERTGVGQIFRRVLPQAPNSINQK